MAYWFTTHVKLSHGAMDEREVRADYTKQGAHTTHKHEHLGTTNKYTDTLEGETNHINILKRWCEKEEQKKSNKKKRGAQIVF